MTHPTWSGTRWEVALGDCLDVLRGMADASVDSVVTDPPAGIDFMGKSWDCFRRSRNLVDVGRDDPFGRASRTSPHSYGESDRGRFVEFLRAVFEECLRVLKPGGHAVVWALPRTSHWTAWALEDAGFEIRDSVHHCFGTGMLKGLNVAKAADKAAGVQPIGEKPASLGMVVGPNADQWNACERQLVMPPPTTDAAKAWDGWNTMLAPGHEVWWLARKSLSEDTVEANVRRWGTGAINVGACKVGSEKHTFFSKGIRPGSHNLVGDEWDGGQGEKTVEGRMPKNLVFSHDEACAEGQPCADGCAVAALDERVKSSRSRKGKPRASAKPGDGWGMIKTGAEYNDEGGPSRFFPCFYSAKASRSEKDAGLPEGTRNHHPTPKAVGLMRWLVRLVTPPGGLVCDPFMGSAGTGCAALLEGFSFGGVERDESYMEVARARLAHWEKEAPSGTRA